jgi:hypothetical protein
LSTIEKIVTLSTPFIENDWLFSAEELIPKKGI